MAAMVQTTVRRAVEALLRGDASVFDLVADEEARIDAEEVELERQAITLLALQAPAASDLRTVLAIVKINADLERIADCALNIAQQLSPLTSVRYDLPRDMRQMAENVLAQMDETMRSLENKDTALAQLVCRGDDVIDALYHQLLQERQAAMMANPQQVPAELALIMIARNLERIGDHCTNIAEDVVFRMHGRIVRHTHDPR
jgi:phosphate transport system protein